MGRRRHLSLLIILAVLAAVAAVASCGRDHPVVSTATASASPELAGASVASATPEGEDGQWPLAGKTPGNTRYSGLDEITTENVARLRVAWSFVTGTDRGLEAAPIVVGGSMYLVMPFPNKVFALDVSRPGANLRWTFEPKPDPSSQGAACCDVVNRGAAYGDGRIYLNTLDDQTIALDAGSGREIWRAHLGDVQKGETMTMAPLFVKGKVLVGNSGGEMGVRGWLTALDAATGHIAWRAYSTGPDADVLIGPEFHPFYETDRGTDLGVHTWPPDHWKIGGGTVWGFVSYDPELDLVYYGTANPGPWNHELRPGDNKWTAGIFARRPDDGHAVWFYQMSPHDLYDHDGVNENVLVDLTVAGARRHVLLHPDRNGYLYVIDRATGEVLSATPFVHVTTSTGVDLKTGKLQRVAGKAPQMGKLVREICPAAPGAKDWQPSAFSPKTGLLYIPYQNLCEDEEGVEANYIAGTPYVGANVRMYGGPGGFRGEFSAWDPVAARKVWTLHEDFPVWSGALVTAGNVVFYGTMDGWFKAVDARSGVVLYAFHAESGIIGQPISYQGADGHQYIAVLAGVGGWAGALVSAGLVPTDQTAALGFVNATRDLPARTRKGGKLYVFALP